MMYHGDILQQVSTHQQFIFPISSVQKLYVVMQILKKNSQYFPMSPHPSFDWNVTLICLDNILPKFCSLPLTYLDNILPFHTSIFDWSVCCHVSYRSLILNLRLVSVLNGQYFVMFHSSYFVSYPVIWLGNLCLDFFFMFSILQRFMPLIFFDIFAMFITSHLLL